MHTFNFCPQPYFLHYFIHFMGNCAWSSEPPLLSMHQSTLMCKLRHACLLPCFWSDWKNRPENVHLIGLDDVSTYYYKLWSKVNCRAVRVCLRITIFLLWCKRFWEIIILHTFFFGCINSNSRRQKTQMKSSGVR